MIVKCIANSRESLRFGPYLDNFSFRVSSEEVNLAIGRCYFVLGIVLRDEVPWYLICEDETDDYPHPHIFAFFEVLDGRLPGGWSFAIGNSNAGKFSLLPTGWACDKSFLEKLMDGNSAAVEDYRKIQRGVELWHKSNSASDPALESTEDYKSSGR